MASSPPATRGSSRPPAPGRTPLGRRPLGWDLLAWSVAFVHSSRRVLRGDADELRRVGSHRQFLIGHHSGAYGAAVGLWVVGIHRAVVGWITGIRRSPMASARTARSFSSTTPAWRALVHVRTEHDHQPSPLLVAVEVDGRRTRLAGARPRSFRVTPDIPDRRRATQQKEVRPAGPTASKRVSSPPVATLSSAPAITDVGITTASLRAAAAIHTARLSPQIQIRSPAEVGGPAHHSPGIRRARPDW
jgi:hypothetical protein